LGEALAVLMVLGLLGLLLLAPVLAVVALVRVRRLEARLAGLDRRQEGFEKAWAAQRAGDATSRPRAAEPVPAAAPLAPAAPAVAPPVVAPPPVAPPPTPVAPTPAAPVAQTPVAPPSPEPAVIASAPRPAARSSAPLPSGEGRSQPPRSGAPPSQPPPSQPPRPQPPLPEAAPFDWENLLGLKAAAWLGGITLVIASLFFAKWAIDRDLITPELRLVTMIAVGVGALVWAEISLRRGYTTAAHAVSGAGIAILYVAFYSGHALFGLLPLWLTFAMMAATTAVAGLLAIRYDALFTALLGLLGGFATPVALSTGVDRPVGLFTYLLLLDLGLATVAIRKRWHGLVLLALAGTFLLELGWFFSFMSPAKAVVGLGAFLTFGLMFLLLPLVAGREDDDTLRVTSVLGALVPFVFAVLIAPRPAFAGEWPLLFGFVALLDAALLAVAVRRDRVPLLLGGALATALVLPLWAWTGLERGAVWGPTLAAIGLAALLNVGPRIAAWWVGPDEERDRGLAASGVFGLVGLGLFAAVMVLRELGDPAGPFLAAVLALALLLIERNATARWTIVPIAGALSLAALIQLWFFLQTEPEHLLGDLVPGLLLTGLLASAATLRGRAQADTLEDDIGVLLANGVAVAGLFGCLADAARGREPLPLFAALAVSLLFLLHTMWRRAWAPLAAIGLVGSALFATAWQWSYFQVADVSFVLPAYALFALAFLSVPFVLAGRRWHDRPSLWATSALALPAFFAPVHHAVVAAWGKATIGALPLAMAAVSVAALALVARRFPAGTDARGDALRLRYLALYASVALGFLALAVPLQLDRQWITVGWAVLAAAICWLYGRLPHAGLKTFAAVLFAAVGFRLVLNPEVFRYQPRGLPIVNWLLYTYGVPALCCFLGAYWLRQADRARPDGGEEAPSFLRLASFVSLLGLLLVFALVNVEIVDFYSTGPYPELALERQLARDLTMSVAWGLYAILLLVLGIWREVKALRILALGFLYLTAFKVFLYDLGQLEGLYRVLSLVGLAVSMIVVSLLLQRFVTGKDRAR
jgi:uncharacterized membrane protein